MRRNLRLTGFAIVFTTALMLVADVFKHSAEEEGVRSKTEASPAGFIHYLSGTGKTETALRGRVTMVAEETQEAEGGNSTFIPRYRVEGDDPTPSNDGMALTNSVIVSNDGADSSDRGFRVDSPECWLPVDDGSASLRFDFDQLWQLTKPVFLINNFGDGGTLKIKSALAQLDPQTNLVFADGFFTLDTGDLHLEGQSLTFDPSTSRIDFTPYHGLLRWSIRNADGQVIQGDCDGPGSFIALENGDYLLTLESKTSVRTHFPAGGSIIGDIETPKLELRLSPSESGNWRPRLAKFQQPTLWHGETLQLRGADSTISWLGDGSLHDLIINGEINVVPNNGAFLKTTAKKHARLFANENVIHLAGDVTVHRLDGSVKGQLAILKEDSLTMEGGVSVIGSQGTAVADKFSTDAQNNWQLDGNAYIKPSDEQITWLAAEHLSYAAGGAITGHGGFSAELLVAGSPAKIACDDFSSTSQQHFNASIGTYRSSHATGNVILENINGVVFGDVLKQLDADRFRVSSADGRPPAHGTLTFNQRPVSFSANDILYSPQLITFTGAPQIDAPTGGLNLLHEAVILTARKIDFEVDDQRWLAKEDVVFQGAIIGRADSLELSQKSISLHSGSLSKTPICKIQTTLADKTEIALEGEAIDFVFGESLTIHKNAFVSRSSGDNEWLRCNKFSATAAGGEASGALSALLSDSNMTAQRLIWESSDIGESFVLSGNPTLMHQQATVLGNTIEFAPGLSTITALGDEINLASIKRSNGQSTTGVWVKYNYETQSLNARSATFKDK
jgi:hypothetical protein